MLRGFDNAPQEWSISYNKNIGNKQLDGVVLRATRWAWWHQASINGVITPASDASIAKALRDSGFTLKNTGRAIGQTLDYRLKKLVKAGYLSAPYRGGAYYHITAKTDPFAIEVMKKQEELERQRYERPRIMTEHFNKLINQILPGAGTDVRVEVVNSIRNDAPPIWDRTVANSIVQNCTVRVDLGTLGYILELARDHSNQMDQARAETEALD